MIVAGAASGIGRAAAISMAASKAHLLLADVDQAGLSETAESCRAAGTDVIEHVCDIRGEADALSLMSLADVEWGQIHGLLNCVGITGSAGMLSHEVQLAEFDRVVRTNLNAAFALTRAVLPYMLKHQYGRILHLSSIAGKEGNPGMVAYSASKAALIGMVKTQGKEYAREGITVNALAPAVVMTPLVEAMPEHLVEYMTARIPMGRLCTLDEVATQIMWIMSPEASFTTGFTFDLSGGRATY
jgi:Dehydrogenases with different specificities (related to short-chain alcohol dehydrogenases)